jgi:hypothetical protein
MGKCTIFDEESTSPWVPNSGERKRRASFVMGSFMGI